MAKFAAILLVAFAFQAALAAPPAKGAEKTQLEQVGDQIQTVTNDITTTIQKHIPDAKDIAAHSDELVQNLESLLKKFQTQLDSHKGERDDLLKDVSGKLSDSINSLQQLSGPDATKKANELKTQLENLAGDFQNFGKTIQPNLQEAGDNVGTFAKGVLDDFLKAAQTFQTQVKDAVEKH